MFNKNKIYKPIILVSFIIVYYFLSNHFFGFFCPLMAFIGVPCPFCGMTRAGILMLTFNFRESFAMHPLLVPTVILILTYFLFKVKYPKKIKKLYTPTIILIISSFLLLAYRIYTNFGQEPIVFNNNSLLMRILEQF
ncbi:MAG: DUF2752 domain-containing protein [Defluviitaleaceae bacterium]|nr:DUF2752 domain-containing protein [Defluviitaleaceae bacterium]